MEHLRSDVIHSREAVLHLEPAAVLAGAKNAGLCPLQQLIDIVNHAASGGAQRIFIIEQASPRRRDLEVPGMPGSHPGEEPIAIPGREHGKEQAVVEDVIHQEGFHAAWELPGRGWDRLRDGDNRGAREELPIARRDPAPGACVRLDDVERAAKLAKGEPEPDFVLESGTDLDEDTVAVEGMPREERPPDRSDPQIPAVGNHGSHIIGLVACVHISGIYTR